MDKEHCKTRFYKLVYPSVPNEWEIDAIVDEVVAIPQASQELLFDQIPVIWPISHSLCLAFLEDGCRVIEAVPEELVSQWVREILRNYEEDGLASARRLITQVKQDFLRPLRTSNTVSFEDVSTRLRYYLRGISGEQVDLSVDATAYTDTTHFYLPPALSLLDQQVHNRLLYKFILTLHWGFCCLGTFRLRQTLFASAKPESAVRSENFDEPNDRSQAFTKFEKPELAADLFFLTETRRVMAWIKKDLPGLAREFSHLGDEFIKKYGILGDEDDLSARISWLGIFALFAGAAFPPGVEQKLNPPATLMNSSEMVSADLERIYTSIDLNGEKYVRPPLMNLLGRHDFTKADNEIRRKRVVMKENFISLLQSLDRTVGGHPQNEGNQHLPGSVDKAMVVLNNQSEANGDHRLSALLNNPEVEIPDELSELIRNIEKDLGHIPPSYFSAASGAPGRGFNRQDQVDSGLEESFETNHMVFDEWDYRRDGYRKNWCRIFERELPVLHSSFVNLTLEKHRGILLKLRRQFEMMKTSEHFVRRQREGEDLDLDAIVEARGDKRAGISPSSKLFVRLQRNDRDIATIFLVDMSNSTEGWVGTVIKEALVLLCEVMDVAGDAYGILGFSGMRRSRCDLYRIKSIEEPYNQTIHQRINSVLPREYTRMGPAIRYACEKLKTHEARTRLLVVITDGKPEDYDDYKGEYAIEDTKKALMEARGSGLHTFCITVDREAQEYLPQMFGIGNYIFIDEIDKLPARMIDMYRLLTA